MSKLDVCLRHISEVYLYEYYCLGSDEYEISGNDVSYADHSEVMCDDEIFILVK